MLLELVFVLLRFSGFNEIAPNWLSVAMIVSCILDHLAIVNRNMPPE